MFRACLLRAVNALPDPTLVDAIVAYLAARPHAADSATGVARWWLGLDPSAATVAEVEAALQVLVRRGRLRRVVLDGTTAIYSLDDPAAHRH